MYTTILPDHKARITNQVSEQVFTLSKVRVPGSRFISLMGFEEESWGATEYRTFRPEFMEFKFEGGNFEQALDFLHRSDLSNFLKEAALGDAPIEINLARL